MDTAQVYWTFDTSVGGSNSEVGYLSGTTVGASNPDSLEKLQLQQSGAFPLWNQYYSGFYITPAILIQTGALDNNITTTPVNAGLAVQWNAPASSVSFTTGADLVYIPAGVLAKEAFSPAAIMQGQGSRMAITLSSTNGLLLGSTFTYTLPPGVSVAATPNLANTCSPGGGTVTASGNTISVSGLQLQPIVAGAPAYICSIALDVRGTAAGLHTPGFVSSDRSVGHRVNDYGTLEVMPLVALSAVFSPTVIAENGVSKLTVTVSNRDPGGAHNAQDFIYDTLNTNLIASASPPVVSNTCPGAPTVTASGTQLMFSQINLPAAPSSSTPYTCQIAVDMISPLEGDYEANYVSSISGAAPPYGSPTPQLHVTKAVQVDARFNPAQTVAGAVTRFEMTVTNSSLNPFSGANFSYQFNSMDIEPAATPNLTNTCLPGGTVTLSSTGVDVTSLALNAATTASYTCAIAFDVQVSAAPSSNFYQASFNTPDQSAASPTGYAELYVFTTPSGGAVVSLSLEKSVIAVNEPNSVTLTFSSNEPTPLSGLDVAYTFSSSAVSLGAPVSTCPAGAGLALSATEFSVTGLSLPAAGATPYSCTVTFNFTASVPITYDIFQNSSNGPWVGMINGSKRFTVLDSFLLPPQPPVAEVAVPSLSWQGLLSLASLLLIGGGAMTARRTSGKRQ